MRAQGPVTANAMADQHHPPLWVKNENRGNTRCQDGGVLLRVTQDSEQTIVTHKLIDHILIISGRVKCHNGDALPPRLMRRGSVTQGWQKFCTQSATRCRENDQARTWHAGTQ